MNINPPKKLKHPRWKKWVKWLKWWQKRKKFRPTRKQKPLKFVVVYNKWKPFIKTKKWRVLKKALKKALCILIKEKEAPMEFYIKNNCQKKQKIDKAIKHFEARLDQVLKKCLLNSLKTSRELLNQGYFKVNGNVERKPNKKIKKGDVITVTKKGLYVVQDTIIKRHRNIHWRLLGRNEPRKRPKKFKMARHIEKKRWFSKIRRPWSRFMYFFIDRPDYAIVNFNIMYIRIEREISGSYLVKNTLFERTKGPRWFIQNLFAHYNDYK